MKFRYGFVSNSSSTSFVCINWNDKLKNQLKPYKSIVIPDTFEGNLKFGWAFEKFNDIGSKINYLCLQILTLKEAYENTEMYCKEVREEYKKKGSQWGGFFFQLKKILERNFKCPIEWNFYKEGMKHIDETDPDWVPGQTDYDGEIATTQIKWIGYGLENNIESTPEWHRWKEENEKLSECYIDHQSNALENFSEFEEIFDSDESLEQFLFYSGSYIKMGNDNETEDDYFD
jgi:hypothetical protein